MKTQITIEKLERIIDAAKRAQKNDSSLSNTIELEVAKKADTHTGSDMVGVILLSSYSDCNGTVIFFN